MNLRLSAELRPQFLRPARNLVYFIVRLCKIYLGQNWCIKIQGWKCLKSYKILLWLIGNFQKLNNVIIVTSGIKDSNCNISKSFWIQVLMKRGKDVSVSSLFEIQKLTWLIIERGETNEHLDIDSPQPLTSSLKSSAVRSSRAFFGSTSEDPSAWPAKQHPHLHFCMFLLIFGRILKSNGTDERTCS